MQGRALTTKEKGDFLKKLIRTGGNVSKACAVIRISRTAAYDHKKNDEDFSAAWDEAIEQGVDLAEEELYRRAVKGVKKPVYQGGKRVGYIREYSDSALALLLKTKRPQYRDSLHINNRFSGGLNINFSEMSDEELEAIARGEK